MATDGVRMWRPAGEDRVLLMAGRTTRYAIEPRGEYVFGTVAEQPMRSQDGRDALRPDERRLSQIDHEPSLRAALKPGGFLTRDPRAVERKKYGKPKARRSFQFSKR